MKAQYEKIASLLNLSFHAHRAKNDKADISWHFHDEIEMTYIKQGSGTKYIGNSVSQFRQGEVILLGSGIPHAFKTEKESYPDKLEMAYENWVIQFKEDLPGDLIELPEMKDLKTLLLNAKRGVVFHLKGKELEEFERYFEAIFTESSYFRLMALFKILGMLAQQEKFSFLTNEDAKVTSSGDKEKLLPVYNFATKNFLKKITLPEAASLANMSVTGFCRCFRRINNKTFFEYLNEIRIENACLLLRENQMQITQACFESGFNNYSHFSAQFKKITGITPSMYRKRFEPAATY